MEKYRVDMHMHSTASDGTASPKELAVLCKKAGLEYCALTDHDTTDGVKEFLAEAKRQGLCALPGLEFSTRFTGDMKIIYGEGEDIPDSFEGELHILGYGIDIENEELKKELNYLASTRISRAERMVKKLNDAGIDVDLLRVKEIAGGGVMGRPHIAAALIEKGYCSHIAEAFRLFLSRGCPGFIERKSITCKRAIELILGAGGVPVFAHPGITGARDTSALVDYLVSFGLKGIEVYYPTHTNEQVKEYSQIAKERNLLMTCGSDYHGEARRHSSIGGEKRGSSDMKKSVIEIFDIFRQES